MLSMTEDLAMTADRRKLCLEITRNLARLPCAACFTSSSGDEINLTIIEQRLVGNEYESVQDWDTDVQMILYNTEKFNGGEPHLIILAQALIQNFRRMKKPIDVQSLRGWMYRVTHLEKKFFDCVARPCDVLRGNFDTDPVSVETEPMPEEDIRALFKAVKMLTRPSDFLFVNNVLMAFTKLNLKNETLTVDVRQLPSSAQRVLREYAQKRLGSEYPQA